VSARFHVLVLNKCVDKLRQNMVYIVDYYSKMQDRATCLEGVGWCIAEAGVADLG
jgi:hypothetical protein